MKLIYTDRIETIQIAQAFNVVRGLLNDLTVLDNLVGLSADKKSEETIISKVAYFLGLVVKGESVEDAFAEAKSIVGSVDAYRIQRGK